MSDVPKDSLNEISQALYAGHKILAIKLYREEFNVSLADAKRSIEGMEDMLRRATPDAFRATPMGSDDWQTTLLGMLKGGGEAGEGLSEETAAEITEALFASEKIHAVKVYREAQGGGLKDAKEAMDALEKALREECPEKFQYAAKRGCLGLFLVGGLLATLANWGLG